MGQNVINALVAVASSLIGLAALSAFLSKNANTTAVISSGSSALNSGIAVALSPITGNTYGASTTGPGF